MRISQLFITQRLNNKLSQISNHPITTVIAPMGYGKTTAVKWWSIRRKKGNKPHRVFRQTVMTDSVADFWTEFCKIFKEYPDLYEQLTALGYPNNFNSLSILLELLNAELSEYEGDVYYIIDDLHLVPTNVILPFISFFVENMPSNLHIILISRNQIFNEKARMELGHMLFEISAYDLSLNANELYEYAEQCEVEASLPELDELARSSEGWFSIIYLNFKSYEKSGKWLSGSADIISLIDEVLLKPLSEEERDFLILMGISNEFSKRQAAYLWTGNNSGELLGSLSENNAFITRTGRFYRYHHMLRQCVRHHFSKKPLEYQQKSYTRLGDWYMEQKDYALAYSAYIKAGNYDKFLSCMEEDRTESIYAEYAEDFFKWMLDCPEEILLRYPGALAVAMLAMFTFNSVEEFYRLKELLLKSLEINDTLSEEEKNNLLGDAAVSECVTAFNDISKMGKFLRRACTLLSRITYIINFNDMWTFGSPSVLMLYHRTAGSADAEHEALKEYMPYYYQITDGHGSGAEHVFAAELHFERGEFVEADISNKTAMSAAKRKDQFSIMVASEFLNMRLELLNGNSDKIKESVDQMGEMLRKEKQYALLNTLDVCRMFIAASLGRTQDAPEWMEEEDIYDLSMLLMAMPMLHTFYNQLLLAKGEYAAVIARKEECEFLYEIFSNILCSIWLHIQLAAAFEKIGKAEDALSELKIALSLAMPDRILMPFAENKNYISKTLLELKEVEEYSEYIDKILELADGVQSGREKILSKHLEKYSYYGLSERELEIAQLAAGRITSAEIAKRLNISPGTVRNHLSRIFDKMGIVGSGKNKRVELEKIFTEQKMPK
jgi:LuxR family maltose regulon positive regulatory protein